MGFSLKRALAGAVAGAANAVGEIADLQLKEAAAARLREQELADKRTLMGEENELLVQREKRVAEMKSKMLDDERTKIGGMVKEFKTGYKGDITTPAGQRYLAGKFGEMGRTDLANIYEDNARAAEQTQNSHLDRQAQLRIAATNSRDNRDAIRQRREEVQAAKDAALIEKKNNMLFSQVRTLADRVGTRGHDGKFIRNDSGLAIGTEIANFALDSGKTHTQAAEFAQNAMSRFNEELQKNPNADPIEFVGKLREHLGNRLLDERNAVGAEQFNASGKRFAIQPAAQLPDASFTLDNQPSGIISKAQNW